VPASSYTATAANTAAKVEARCRHKATGLDIGPADNYSWTAPDGPPIPTDQKVGSSSSHLRRRRALTSVFHADSGRAVVAFI
jgi:hypothetical protein